MIKAFSIRGGPGCGKTATMMKVISRLKHEGYDNDDIAFVSHTRAASEEALSRLGIGKSPNVCTLHSMAFRLLGMSSIQVVDYKKLRKFSELINIPITGKRFEEEERSVGDEYMDIIGYSKNKRIPVYDAYCSSDRPGKMNEFLVFADSYEKWKQSYGYKDFNDMLYDCLAENLSPKVRALIVDEAQDLSTVQWELVKMFLSHGNIDRVYIAGDPDQNINSWAGSEPKGMDVFEEQYGCERIFLEKSYRLPTNIHSLCKKVISRINDRIDNPFVSNGNTGEINLCNSIWKTNLKHGDDTMVLARTHRELRELEDYFVRRKLPYVKNGSIGFFDNRHAKAVLAFNKLKSGGTPTEKDIRLFDLVGTKLGRKLVADFDWDRLCSSPILSVIKFPYGMESYYTSTDFNQVPTIRLSTMHASKGHEAEVVVVNTKMPDNIRRQWDKVWEEETRLLYVSLSRSKSKLHVILTSDGYKVDRQFN